MFSAADIRDAIFSKAMSGYKKEEVDQFLAQVEQDYRQFAKSVTEYENKIQTLEQEKETFKASSESIQAVLLNAQKLADQMVADAKAKSEEILQKAQTNIEVMTAQEKELSSVFEMKANERKAVLEKELTEMIRDAKGKAAAIEAAAEDAVRRQQLLFDKLQMEISSFRSTVTAKYKEHLELLKTLPETAPADPTRMAEIVEEAYNKVPEPETFFAEKEEKTEETGEEEMKLSEIAEEDAELPEKGDPSQGFKVTV